MTAEAQAGHRHRAAPGGDLHGQPQRRAVVDGDTVK